MFCCLATSGRMKRVTRICINFTKLSAHKRPGRRIPRAIFTKLHAGSCVTILADSLKNIQSYGGLSLGCVRCSKFSAPPSGETASGANMLLEVQERYGPRLSPCKVAGWWGSVCAHRGGGGEKVLFTSSSARSV